MIQFLSGSQKYYLAIDSGDNFTSCEKRRPDEQGRMIMCHENEIICHMQ